MNHSAQQTAGASLPATMPGRDSAPTGAPMGASAHMGGEGSPAARVQARKGGVQARRFAEVFGRALAAFRKRLPKVALRSVEIWGGAWVGVYVCSEGVFISAKPYELAILHPSIEL